MGYQSERYLMRILPFVILEVLNQLGQDIPCWLLADDR